MERSKHSNKILFPASQTVNDVSCSISEDCFQYMYTEIFICHHCAINNFHFRTCSSASMQHSISVLTLSSVLANKNGGISLQKRLENVMVIGLTDQSIYTLLAKGVLSSGPRAISPRYLHIAYTNILFQRYNVKSKSTMKQYFWP